MKKVQFSACMDQALLNQGRRHAMEEGRSFSWLLEHALVMYFERTVAKERVQKCRKRKPKVGLV